MPDFTVDWFSGHIPNWTTWLAHLKGLPCHLLEIGCLEGRSTLWLLENIMVHKDSHIWCIDSFQGGDEHKDWDFGAVRKRFESNVSAHANKVTLMVGMSADVLKSDLPLMQFAYVDGSHKADDVYSDGLLTWPHLSLGAVMIFDDYEWDGCSKSEPTTKFGIDRFLNCITGRYQIINKGYQFALTKMKA